MVAVLTLIRLDPTVDFQVLIEVALIGKGLGADLAFVWSLCAVRLEVRLEVGFPCEGLGADIALERPLVAMVAEMRFEEVQLWE